MWLQEHPQKQIALYWNLNVLPPDNFQPTFPAESGIDRVCFEAAIGLPALNQVSDLLNQISKESELVSLSIAEHMPWDALRLNHVLKQFAIFD